MGLPLLGYARVSTEEQSDRGLSLDAQCAAIRGYCAARGLTLLDILVDPAVSGSVELAKRPAGAQLLRHLQSGQVGGVVVTKLDRAFRDTIDCLTIAREWDDLGVGLHLLDIGGMSLDTRSAIGRYFLTMLAGFAELERGLIAERIRAAGAAVAPHTGPARRPTRGHRRAPAAAGAGDADGAAARGRAARRAAWAVRGEKREGVTTNSAAPVTPAGAALRCGMPPTSPG